MSTTKRQARHAGLLYLLLALSACAFMACDKDNNDDPDTPPGPGSPTIEDFAPLAIGNYWVYERYWYDSLGNETLTPLTDSLAVVGDTVHNGNTYFILQGTRQVMMNQPYRSYVRDSADCLIGLGGGVSFSLSDLGSVLYVSDYPPPATITWSTQPTTVVHTVPAGTWTCYVTNGVVEYPGFPTRIIRRFRGQGIGPVQDESVYAEPGAGFRHKLVRYHLE